MITSVYHRPFVYTDSWSPMVWQVASDKTNELDFKYVFDIYINGSFNNRIKQRPNPSGYGLLDASTFAQGALSVGESLVEALGYTGMYRDGRDICGEIHLKVGEEYRGATAAALVIYNGVGNTAGAPAYWLGPATDGELVTATGGTGNCIFTSGYKTAWQNYELEVKGFTATDYQYSMVAGNDGKFLSKLPDDGSGTRYADMQEDDRFSLTFWNNNFRTSPTGPYVDYVTYDFYDATGTSIGSTAVYNTGTGTTARNNIMQVSAGPLDLLEKIGPTPTGTAYYQITAVDEDDNAVSEIIQVNIVEPDCWGFGRWRFSWLNSLGGRDWFNFVKQNTELYEADRSTYYKLEPYWSGGIYGASTLGTDLYGDSVNNNTISIRHTAMSDWVTPEISTFLQGLFTSSHVLAWDPENRGPFLAQINSKSYEVKNYAREKMFNYTIDFTIGQPINAQFA